MTVVETREMGMSRLAFLTERSWMDHDEKHVWTAHDCNGVRVTTMLPWPTWRRVENVISPSVSCEACGAHYMGRLNRTTDDFHSNAACGLADPLDLNAPWPDEFPRDAS